MATTKTTEAGDQAAVTQDGATANELARIQANQDRYDARVSGKSSAELNAEELKKREEGKDKPEPQKGGGQTLPAHEATGEPADGAVAAEPPKEAKPASTSSTTSNSASSSSSR